MKIQLRMDLIIKEKIKIRTVSIIADAHIKELRIANAYQMHIYFASAINLCLHEYL